MLGLLGCAHPATRTAFHPCLRAKLFRKAHPSVLLVNASFWVNPYVLSCEERGPSQLNFDGTRLPCRARMPSGLPVR
jgi:hypothetical protein